MCEIIEIGGVKNGQFTRNHFIKEGDLQNHLHKFNNTDVYRTVYRYENKNIMTTDFIGPLYLDLDIDDIENNFMKIKQTTRRRQTKWRSQQAKVPLFREQ